MSQQAHAQFFAALPGAQHPSYIIETPRERVYRERIAALEAALAAAVARIEALEALHE